MPLIPSFLTRKPPEEKASAAKALIALNRLGAPTWTPRDYMSLARQGYEKMSSPIAACGWWRKPPPRRRCGSLKTAPF